MRYVCRVGNADGKVSEGTFEAANVAALRSDLESRGIHLFEARPESFLSRLIPRRKGARVRRVPMNALLLFNQEFASLLKAGLPMIQSLEMMIDRQRDPDFKHVLEQVRSRVSSGDELSDAISDFGDLFPPLYASTLKAGERSGELESVLRRFIRYQQLVMQARKRVVSALVYPILLVCLSLGLIIILAVFVVPKFTDFFAGLDGELPLITQITIGSSLLIKDNLLWIVLASIAGVFFFRQWKSTETGEVFVDRARLQVPLLGGIFGRLAFSEFCRSMATLLSGGIPLVQAQEVSVSAVGNSYIRKALEPTIVQVRQGQALYAALEETGVVPEITVDMVKVGEATGSLDEMLENVSDFLDDEVETLLQRVLSLLEPIMLVFMGIVVAVLLVSVYLPLVSMLQQIDV